MSKSIFDTNAASKLQSHYNKIKSIHLKTLFKEDPKRASNFSIELDDLFFDYSKNRITDKTLKLFAAAAEEIDINGQIDAMFSGNKINHTENRAVLHTALRDFETTSILVDGENIIPKIQNELSKIQKLCTKIHSGSYLGYTNKPIRNIVNIGIGGSDLGPYMVTEALKEYKKKYLNGYFVSNVDGTHLHEALANLNPEETLFIIASKTFTTQETMTNAESAKKWFLAKAKQKTAVKKHFVALSTNIQAAKEFGIQQENIFGFWDWVGGRYSLWSSIGLSIALLIGYDNFIELLKGANKADKHFKNAPLTQNIPFIMAALGVWYNNFFGADSYAVLPYEQYLHRFPAYLQQADMESNGKYIDKNGNVVNYQTGPVVWGEPGTNGQHAFYQLIHQGTKLIPADFIGFSKSNLVNQNHKPILMANMFAQTQALMNGKTKEEALVELKAAGHRKSEIKNLLPYKVFEGNRPTNTFLFKKLTPKNLGMLIALYEHKIFVQGAMFNVNSFDQWGVELGKKLSNNILPVLLKRAVTQQFDSSTQGLIHKFFAQSDVFWSSNNLKKKRNKL